MVVSQKNIMPRAIVILFSALFITGVTEAYLFSGYQGTSDFIVGNYK